MECPFSKRCWAKLDLLFLYLKSLKCSWKRVLKGLSIWPMYFLLQVGQVSWYIPQLSYFCLVWYCPVVKSLPIVLFTEKVTWTFVFLNALEMTLVSLPAYVNFTQRHFFSFFLCFLSSCTLCLWLRCHSRYYVGLFGWRYFRSLCFPEIIDIGLVCYTDIGLPPFFIL